MLCSRTHLLRSRLTSHWLSPTAATPAIGAANTRPPPATLKKPTYRYSPGEVLTHITIHNLGHSERRTEQHSDGSPTLFRMVPWKFHKILRKVAVGVVRKSRNFSGHPYIGRECRTKLKAHTASIIMEGQQFNASCAITFPLSQPSFSISFPASRVFGNMMNYITRTCHYPQQCQRYCRH